MRLKAYIKNEIYGNCKILSPDGILMFYCSEKKVNWYLKRNLAEIIIDSPLTVKLKFKPNGLGNHNKSYGLSKMKDHCVNCGSTNFLTKHHIVPLCYRRYFPIEIKSHNFHDVLLLCVDCHENYEKEADKLKKLISIEYDAPLNGIREFKSKDIMKCISISKTLANNGLKLPKFKINEMKIFVKNVFNIKRLTSKKLIKISEIKTSILTKTHGEIVISKVNDLQNFIEMWRKHFIEKNKCQYLPENWDIKTRL